MWIFALFLVVPLIEIALFVTVGGWLTLWPTLAIVVGTGLLGAFLVRRQGIAALRDVQTATSQMQNPLSPLAHGFLVVIGGVLLILPGFFTDTLGFLLMVPVVRTWVIRFAASRITFVRPNSGFGQGARRGAEVIDGEYFEVSKPNPTDLPPSKWTQD